MKRKRVVNDLMQKGYVYFLTEPVGENFAPEFQPDMIRLFHPAEGMKTREIAGGTGPQTVAQALAQAERRVSEWRK